jgi:predicted Zn-dependent protease
MSKDEEEQLMAEAMKMMRDMWGSDRVDDDAPFTLWVKEIADRISKVTVDDARAPVREYKEDPKTDYQLHVIWDNETLNALCLGRNIVIYDPLMDLLDYDPDKIAVILSHELGHSLQRHTCEKFGMESLLYSLIDMARGFFWMFTEPLGPYVY